MKINKSLYVVFLAILIFLIQPIYGQIESDIEGHQIADKYRQDFFIRSKYALGEEFVIKILLPTDYYDTNNKYPVMYLTDADFCFGFASDMAYHLDLNSKRLILVGISYGSKEKAWKKRTIDFFAYNFNKEKIPGYSLFKSFFTEELFPYIESNFRAESTNRTLFGWSAGFVFACHTLYEDRLLFDNYILGGGRFPKDWDNELYSNLSNIKRQKWTERPISIYVGQPELDGSPETFIQSIEYLKEQDFADLFIKWDIIEGKGHAMPAMADILINGMEYTFNKKSIMTNFLESLEKKGINTAINDYERWGTIRQELCDYNPDELIKIAKILEADNKLEEKAILQNYIDLNFPKKNVTFNVTSNDLPGNIRIFITGDHDELGNWDPGKIALDRIDNINWNKTIPVLKNTSLEYKFTLGTWDSEALNEDGTIKSNLTLQANSDTTINITINKWMNFNK